MFYHWLGYQADMVRQAKAQAAYTEVSRKMMEAPRPVTILSPLDEQVGGSHYKKYKIQPVEYAMANNLNYCQANAVKYTTRYKDKGGVEDLRKAIHNLEILIELEEQNGRLA